MFGLEMFEDAMLWEATERILKGLRHEETQFLWFGSEKAGLSGVLTSRLQPYLKQDIEIHQPGGNQEEYQVQDPLYAKWMQRYEKYQPVVVDLEQEETELVEKLFSNSMMCRVIK